MVVELEAGIDQCFTELEQCGQDVASCPVPPGAPIFDAEGLFLQTTSPLPLGDVASQPFGASVPGPNVNTELMSGSPSCDVFTVWFTCED